MSVQLRQEEARLQALYELNILDTADEAVFDNITRLVSRTFSAPIALVSLVDRDRQWFKSRVGLDVCETGRDVSFCAHALGKAEPLVVEDVRSDVRFKDNPLVTVEPHIRFYAGAQIRTRSGFDLGTLCVMDTEPRSRPSGEELSVLTELAGVVTHLIEQRILVRELAEETERRRVAEEKAIAAKEEAERANAAMRTFFSKMSHDLRSPLGAILGFAEFLRESDLTDEQKQDAKDIYDAGKTMLALVDELLRVAPAELDGEDPRVEQRSYGV